jgi:serine O-acetyltransferase
MALTFGIDINPAARLGCGIMIDHGTGVVIGETTVVENGVSMLQGVTLGGTGKESGDRHPKIREGVMIGAGARILGCIEVGARAKIGAGSVVLRDVPAGCTAAGVPARIVGACANVEPAREMDQRFGDD